LRERVADADVIDGASIDDLDVVFFVSAATGDEEPNEKGSKG
jgi:hypothetical protein